MRIPLLVGGGVLILIGVIIFGSGMASMSSDGPPNMGLMFLGGLFLPAGVLLVKLGLVKTVANYVAGETKDAVATTASAFGKGWTQGTGDAFAAPSTVVRLKCRACGALDSEDAKFCSGCGQAM